MTENMTDMEQVIMNLIVNSGAAKSCAYNALNKVKEKQYDDAEVDMKQAHEYLLLAHNEQTSLLSIEASGEKIDVSVLFIHAQDHLMAAISEITLIEHIIDLQKTVNEFVR